MPVIPNGGSLDLPSHKHAVVVVGAAEGVVATTLKAEDTTLARIDETGTDEFELHPLALGTTTLRAYGDGDLGPGTLPLAWTATLTVVETVALSLQVSLIVSGESEVQLPTLGSEWNVPLNHTAQLRIVAIGKSGQPVALDPDTIEWASGNETAFTLTENAENPQHGDVQPLSQLATVSWAFSAAADSDDPGGATIEAAGVLSIDADASAALVVEVDVL